MMSSIFSFFFLISFLGVACFYPQVPPNKSVHESSGEQGNTLTNSGTLQTVYFDMPAYLSGAVIGKGALNIFSFPGV